MGCISMYILFEQIINQNAEITVSSSLLYLGVLNASQAFWEIFSLHTAVIQLLKPDNRQSTSPRV